MADNYLEKKMEEHRKASPQPPRQRLTPSGNRPGKLVVDFPPRRVYVTGGASGIGAAIVKAFCDAGCKVAFCDIDLRKGATTAQKCGAQFHPLDVTDTPALEASIGRVQQQWGAIDVMINNVGIGAFKPFEEASLEDFRHVLATNLIPVWVTSHAMASQPAEPGCRRRIINICSTRRSMSEPGTEAYSASKGAIASLTHALMASLAPKHITANCISPGWIDTAAGTGIRPADHEFHPSGRVGLPDDIAAMCVFLASPAADFINGENIVVDGGVTRKMIYPE